MFRIFRAILLGLSLVGVRPFGWPTGSGEPGLGRDNN